MLITDTSRLLTPGTPCDQGCCIWMRPVGHKHNIACARHLERGLEPELRAITLSNIIRILGYHDFDAIAFQGLSGALFAPMVAFIMDKTLLAVRKGEECHSSRQVEGDYAARRYVILDDFIAMGSTIQRITSEIKDAIPTAHCIGILEYAYITRHTVPLTALSSADKYTAQKGRPLNAWTEVGVIKTESVSFDELVEKYKPAPDDFPVWAQPVVANWLPNASVKVIEMEKECPLVMDNADSRTSPPITLDQVRKAVEVLNVNQAKWIDRYRMDGSVETILNTEKI